MLNPVIYLDYNATTPVDPQVMNEMLPYFLSSYGNPSSNDHLLGWQAREALDRARSELASVLGAGKARVLFTAGATESINMILRGYKQANKHHIITCRTEHSAVLDTCKELEQGGYSVTYLEVNEDGLIDLAELEAAITEETLLVSIMWVNNETGVIQPVEAIGQLCQAKGIMYMADATQAVGKIDIDLDNLPIDVILGSAHKIYGPKGVGFLAIKEQWLKGLAPIITGGGQENRQRAGTTNLPGIIGLVKAVSLANRLLEEDSQKIQSLRDQFESTLCKKFDIKVNGSKEYRLYNTSNICFKGCDSERMMQAIGGKVAASRGSACSTDRIEPSHVLAAMGLTDDEAHASIRFSFGRFTNDEEINSSISLISTILIS